MLVSVVIWHGLQACQGNVCGVDPLPTDPHDRGQVPDTYGAVHGSRDPRLIKLPPRCACVDVTPNLVWIAQVGDRVQVIHDRGHVLAHEAEDVVTKVRTRPRENGLLMAGSGCGRHVHVIVAEIGYRVRGDDTAKFGKNRRECTRSRPSRRRGR